MASTDPHAKIREHLTVFFEGHDCKECTWSQGPAIKEWPQLRVLEFTPGPRSGLWIYASVGAWEVCSDPKLEFLILAPFQNLRHVELLFMTAWYHSKHQLGTGHTLPIGEPWLKRSTCEYFVLSKLYTLDPVLEICEVADFHVHFLWALPITQAERDFKVKEGLEALEQRFEAHKLEYWDAQRKSVI